MNTVPLSAISAMVQRIQMLKDWGPFKKDQYVDCMTEEVAAIGLTRFEDYNPIGSHPKPVPSQLGGIVVQMQLMKNIGKHKSNAVVNGELAEIVQLQLVHGTDYVTKGVAKAGKTSDLAAVIEQRQEATA